MQIIRMLVWRKIIGNKMERMSDVCSQKPKFQILKGVPIIFRSETLFVFVLFFYFLLKFRTTQTLRGVSIVLEYDATTLTLRPKSLSKSSLMIKPNKSENHGFVPY